MLHHHELNRRLFTHMCTHAYMRTYMRIQNADMNLQMDSKLDNYHRVIINSLCWTKFICISMDRNHRPAAGFLYFTGSGNSSEGKRSADSFRGHPKAYHGSDAQSDAGELLNVLELRSRSQHKVAAYELHI